MENWCIIRKGYDSETHNHFAPVNTVGNGFVCCRGFMEEQQEGIAGLGGIYMAGVFGNTSYYQPWKGEAQELVNIPNFLWNAIEINDAPLKLTPDRLGNYSEELNLREGTFRRSYVYTEAGTPVVEFEFTRFVSRADIRFAGQRIRVTPLRDGLVIRMRMGFNADITNLNEISSEPHPVQPGRRHCHVVSRDTGMLRVRVQNRAETEIILRQRITGNTEILPAEDAMCAYIEKAKGETALLEKLVMITAPSHNPQGNAVSSLNPLNSQDGFPSFAEVFKAHTAAMSDFWALADVVVEGDDEVQTSLRYNIFQLDQSCPRHKGRVSIGARGLTGEMYEGSVFWDTEIFMLPFFTLTDPAAARNLLLFRYHTLPEARAHALSNWFQGAMYGWQVNAAGTEQTPQGVGAYYSVHIVADVAFAVLEYWHATGDDTFILRYGLEILIETARFWASRVTLRRDGYYDILAVRGPNEYDVLVNNNLYTNMMARENFLLCERIFHLFSEKYPEPLAKLEKQLQLTEEELAEWRKISEKILLPFEEKKNLWLEDDTWLRRKPLDMARAKPTAKRIIDTTIPYEALPFYQVTKQADVLHVMKNLPWHFTAAQVEIAFDYYKTKTAFDSSLAYSMFALMAARLGRTEEALDYFNNCLNLDLKNVQLNTISGLHFANFGGSWQVAVFGFGGVAVMADCLSISPNLPAHWQRMFFNLRYRGGRLAVEISAAAVRVTLAEPGDSPIKLSLSGQTFTMANTGDRADINFTMSD